MPVSHPRTRLVAFRPALAGLAVALALIGCKSDSNSRGSGDPLFGTHIPPQNMPMPDRGIGANGKDPLIGTPTKPVDRTGVGYTDDPARFKERYVPGPSSTPSALTVGNAKDGDELKIDGNENRVPLQPAGGPASPPAANLPSSSALDAFYRDLDQQYGCKAGDRSLTQESGQYIFRASIVRDKATGARLQCTGVGTTPEDAVRQVIDTAASERK